MKAAPLFSYIASDERGETFASFDVEVMFLVSYVTKGCNVLRKDNIMVIYYEGI